MDVTESLLCLLHFNNFKYIQLNKVQTFTLTGDGSLTSYTFYSTNHLINKNIQTAISKTHHSPNSLILPSVNAISFIKFKAAFYQQFLIFYPKHHLLILGRGGTPNTELIEVINLRQLWIANTFAVLILNWKTF